VNHSWLGTYRAPARAQGPGDPVDQFFAGRFGWANYVRLVTDEFVIGRLLRTLVIGAIVTLGTFIVGVPLAMALWRMSGRAKALLLAVTLTPLLVSIVVSAYGWSVLLGQRGIVNETLRSLGLISRPLKLMHSDIAIIIGLVHILLPFMVLNLLAALERVPRRDGLHGPVQPRDTLELTQRDRARQTKVALVTHGLRASSRFCRAGS
jgi:ABC-type spermidine/putrescine transport system permease subunit I